MAVLAGRWTPQHQAGMERFFILRRSIILTGAALMMKVIPNGVFGSDAYISHVIGE